MGEGARVSNRYNPYGANFGAGDEASDETSGGRRSRQGPPGAYGPPSRGRDYAGQSSDHTAGGLRPSQTSRPGVSQPYGVPSRPAHPGDDPSGAYGAASGYSGYGSFGTSAQSSHGSGWGTASPDDYSGNSGYSGADYGGFGAASGPGWRRYGDYGVPEPATGGGYGYGQPSPSSGGGYGGYGGEAWQHSQSSPYGAPYAGGYGQPGPTSQSAQSWGGYAPGAHSGWMAPPAAQQARRQSRGRLWLTLGIVAAVLVVSCAGVGYLAYQSFAPAGAVGAFCGSLKAQQYADAYNHFSNGFHQRISASDFAHDASSLDRIEGRVRNCATSGGSGSGFQFSGTTATLSLDLARANGNTLSGTVRLMNEGGWKLDVVDTSIFGVNLDALSSSNAYCDAMTTQNYAALYPSLSAAQQKRLRSADFIQQQQWHDAVDGTASACTLTGLGTANNDAAASVTATLIRQKLGLRQDTLTLDIESGTWKLAAVGQQLQGTDVGGLATSARFCADLTHGNYADAFNLVADNFKGGETEGQFAADVDGANNGVKTTGCTLDVSTYKVTGNTTSVSATLGAQRLYDGATAQVGITIHCSKINDAWLISGLTIPHS